MNIRKVQNIKSNKSENIPINKFGNWTNFMKIWQKKQKKPGYPEDAWKACKLSYFYETTSLFRIVTYKKSFPILLLL